MYIKVGLEIRMLLFYTIYPFYWVVRKSLKGGVALNYPLYVLNTSSGKVYYLGAIQAFQVLLYIIRLLGLIYPY